MGQKPLWLARRTQKGHSGFWFRTVTSLPAQPGSIIKNTMGFGAGLICT